MSYEAADKAVKAINRENLKRFGQMKTRLMKADELHVIREVKDTYSLSLNLVERWFLLVAREAYKQGMKDAKKHRRCPIDKDWLLDWLEETDFVALYRFIPEWERKKERLIEALAVAPDRGREIDKALKAWTKQIGWFSISLTDDATLMALKDAGVKKVEWVTERDGSVCKECAALDGKIFDIEDAPGKQHMNCRCRLRPVL